MTKIFNLIQEREFTIGQRVYFNFPESESVGIVIGYIVYDTALEYQVRTENGVHQLESFCLSEDKIII